MEKFSELLTETINPRTLNIDKADTLAQVTLMNDEDKRVAVAVEEVLPQVAAAVDIVSERLKCGGRLIYVGAGTSGRLGILDASECPPTFGTSPDMVQGIIAGGREAMFCAVEGAEDDATAGETDLAAKKLSPADAVVGIAASGRTPYVAGALRYAEKIGAATVAVTCTDNSLIGQIARVAVEIKTGAEAVTGSTRLKAGTAQKMVLNMISTVAMIKLGKVMGNLMVDVQATNEKLRDRAERIVMSAAHCSKDAARQALSRAGGNAKAAIALVLEQEK